MPNTPRSLPILIVEDDPTVARAISWLLGDTPTQICGTLAEASAALAQGTFQAVILDIYLPDGSGLDLLEWLRARRQTPVLVLTGDDETAHANRAQLLGAEIAYKPDVAPHVRAFAARAQGRTGLHVAIDAFEERGLLAGLTTRERQVLRRLAGGGTQSAAAAELGIGAATVKTLVRRVLQKTGFRNTSELLAAWGVTRDTGRHRRPGLDADAPSEARPTTTPPPDAETASSPLDADDEPSAPGRDGASGA